MTEDAPLEPDDGDQPTWVRKGGTVHGPLPRRMVRLLALGGRLSLDDEVSADGTAWEPVGTATWLGPSPARGGEEGQRNAYLARLFLLTPRTPASSVLIGLNVAAFVACVIAGVGLLHPEAADLIRVGGNFGPLVFAGEWWRIVTATFLHAGLIHLFFNMNALLSLGPLLERFVGTAGFVALYLGSGLLASLASLAVHPETVSVGASGAIFGVIGALIPVLWRQRGVMPRSLLKSMGRSTAVMIVVNVALGFSIPAIDNAAHLGGLVSGALLGFVVAHPLTPEGAKRRGVRAAWAALLAAAAVFAVYLLLPRPDPVRRAVVEPLRVDEAARPDGPAEGPARGGERLPSPVHR